MRLSIHIQHGLRKEDLINAFVLELVPLFEQVEQQTAKGCAGARTGTGAMG